MTDGYVFLGNTTKPTEAIAKSREDIKLSNVTRPYLTAALKLGYNVFLGVNRDRPEDLKCPELPISLYDSHTYRSITALQDNRTAYNNLKKVVKENNVKVIHCNTPVGGTIGRLVGKNCGVDKVIYTVHGFHFYKGAPLINRTLFKWAEKVMARWTNAIITMNQEDFEFAKKLKLKKNGHAYFVHGVGIDTAEYRWDSAIREGKRSQLGLGSGDIMLISAGDLVARKNYSVAIRAVAQSNDKRLKYFICGIGNEEEKLKHLAKELNVSEQIIFLGYRRDMKELLAAADIFLFTSLQEGMPRSLMEAMASSLPCVASKIRGNVDLIDDGENGFLCEATASDQFSEAIVKLTNDSELRSCFGKKNIEKIKQYDVSVVSQEIKNIYAEIFGER